MVPIQGYAGIKPKYGYFNTDYLVGSPAGREFTPVKQPKNDNQRKKVWEF